MLEHFFVDRRVLERLRRGEYGRSLDDLAVHLREHGCAPVTAQVYLRGAGHCAFWLETNGILPAALDEKAVSRFRSHLAECRCSVPFGAPRCDLDAAVGHLLAVLRQSGRTPPALPVPQTPVVRLVASFDGHLERAHGASAQTRGEYGRYVREFLEATFGAEAGRVDPRRIGPADVIGFVTRRAARCSSGTAKLVATALRSFLRFLQTRGQCKRHLVDAVPTIPRWKLSRLPATLSDAQLAGFLAAFDRTTAIGCRDYAIALCLVYLGLRAGEAAGLALEDIDWRAGTVRIGKAKTRRASLLPLPVAVGRAIAAYLRHGRPAGSERMVFVRHTIPIGRRIDSSVVRAAIRRAYERSTVVVPSKGTHTLRHTAAARMLRGGASLKEVADVLRHRCLDTTMVYTKLDLPRLARVALPWPEVRP